MRITQEAENLYRLKQLGMINCFLVKETDHLILIDAGLPGSGSWILYAAKQIGLPIAKIGLTHAHVDHVGSVDQLMRLLPEAELFAGTRESRIMRGDHSLDAGEDGEKLFGFPLVHSLPTHLLNEGDTVGPLKVIDSPGHTPGHIAFLDVRDNTLIAGDTFTTQTGLLVAGVFRLIFPMSSLFCWNAEVAARSAEKLRALQPSRLCVGHGDSLTSPIREMDRAVAVALRQHLHMTKED